MYYANYLTLPKASKDDLEKKGIKKHSIFKYSKDIALAEQIKLGEEYVFLQIIDGKPMLSHVIDLANVQHLMLYPRGSTPIIDFQFDNEEEINQLLDVAKAKSI